MHNHANFSTIKVTGKGVLRLRPDTTRVNVTLNGRHKDYSETVRRSTEDSEKLKDVLEKLGFSRSDLKTLNFRVDPRYESYRENDEYKHRLVGYEFYHGMKLEFRSDRTLLGKVLYALATSGLDPEFSLSYTVSDTEAAKNQLLSAAVADARAKAETLCAAAGNVLGEILHINYSMDEPNFAVRPMAKTMLRADMAANGAEGSFDMDVEPDNIEVSDVVTLIWRTEAAASAAEVY